MYLDLTEAVMIPTAVPESLYVDIVNAYPYMLMCNGVRVQLGFHIMQGAIPRTTLCTEGVTRIISAPPPIWI